MRLPALLVITLSFVMAGCARPIDLHDNDLPVAAPGAPTCGGSTVARGATETLALSSATRTRTSRARSVLYQGISHEDSTASALYLVKADGTGRRESVHGFFDATDPVVSPDGKLVAFVETPASLEHHRLVVANVDGSNQRTLYSSVDDHGYLNSVSWSPDSHRLAFLSDGALQVVDSTGNSLAKPIARISDHLADVWTNAVAWSPNGSSIAFLDGPSEGPSTLTIVGPTGSGRQDVAGTNGSFAWSPDGRSIAFTNRGITVVSVNGGKPKHLVATQEGTGIDNLVWSSDGVHIVFQSGDLDVAEVCVYSLADGSLHRIADCIPTNTAQDLSPDGQEIAFVQSSHIPDCDHSQVHRIAVVPLSGGMVMNVADEGWSPQWVDG